MENASKALLIAGGILITIIIVNVGIILFKNTAQNSSKFYTIMSEHEITEFNEKFTRYQNEKLTVQDFITIMNLARDYNKKNGYTKSNENSIQIEVEDKNFNDVLNREDDNEYKKELRGLLDNNNAISIENKKIEIYFEIINITYNDSKIVKDIKMKMLEC